jgi:uroporphyrinogen III methyltransferase/synthase
VAVIRHVSLPDQKRIDTTLGGVAQVVQSQKLRPPVVFIVGEVAAHHPAWTWFEKRPLFGQKILITRPAHQTDDLAQPLAELGAEVLLQPAIEIRRPQAPELSALSRDRAWNLLDRFDWLVFSSRNGVQFFLGPDLRKLGKIKIAAIGSATAEELARYHRTIPGLLNIRLAPSLLL